MGLASFKQLSGLVRHAFIVTLFLTVAVSGCRDATNLAESERPHVELRGAVEPPETTIVSAPIDGTVMTVSVPVAASVQQGQALFSLNNPSVERDLAYARAQTALAELRLRNTTTRKVTEPDAREIAVAHILRNKTAKLEKYRALFSTHDISEQELREAENEAAMAKREWLAERERRTASVPENKELVRLDLEKARADTEFANGRKALLMIAAPRTGTVVRLHVAPGDRVYPHDPMAEISDRTRMTIRANVAPELLSHIHAGMEVDVKVFTVPPRQFREKISAIRPANGDNPSSIEIVVPNPDAVLQGGLPAVVTVQ
jgi:multidrug resistance efflux pump